MKRPDQQILDAQSTDPIDDENFDLPPERSAVLPRLTPRTLRYDVADALRTAILEGTLAPGMPLVERRISEELGVSRAPVREALRKLEHEGLVTTVPYAGSAVASVGPEQRERLRSLRVVLEVYAAERALPALDAEALRNMKTLQTRWEAAMLAGERELADRLHSAFHRVVYELADHTLLLQIWSMIEGQHRLWTRTTISTPERRAQSIARHQRYFEVLAAGDLEQVRAEIIDHVNWSYALPPEQDRSHSR